MMVTHSLVWLRRDLRLHDHAALSTALAGEGSVQPVFVFDAEILARFDNKYDRRLSFIAGALCEIDATLKKRGGGLLVFHGKPTEIIPKLATALGVSSVVSAADFEPATCARDAAVKAALQGQARFVQVLDHVLNDPRAMLKKDGTPYKVFTPFYKQCWRPAIHESAMGEWAVNDKGRYTDIVASRKAADVLKPLELTSPKHLLEQVGYVYRDDPEWSVNNGPARLKTFVADHLTPYKTQRNFMARHGTSRLGPYLRHGLVSIREAMRAAVEQGHGEAWIGELGWREFYISILTHFPHVVDQEFQSYYRDFPWRSDEKMLEAFKQGQTGYPIVDAAVRELTSTGWMHNRARMITASFFTKHLLMDWRIGEEFFAQHLMDYELASNNGGWQWSASTGTDAQPYFRVFNPVLQSKKFDAGGDYIRHYVPELANLSDKDIHAPFLSKNPPANYPKPIVNHEAARARVLKTFKSARAT